MPAEDRNKLIGIFERLGARDPEGWASSQVDEGVPQLARFLFLRQAWRAVVSEDDATCIGAAIARVESHPREPYAGWATPFEACAGAAQRMRN